MSDLSPPDSVINLIFFVLLCLLRDQPRVCFLDFGGFWVWFSDLFDAERHLKLGKDDNFIVTGGGRELYKNDNFLYLLIVFIILFHPLYASRYLILTWSLF